MARLNAMPEVVTHRYDPAWGAGRNLCALPEEQAGAALERLQSESRPTLKANYLERRRATEEWLAEASIHALRRDFGSRPVYFFLGDFSHHGDPSRPAALVIPLTQLPREAITFTLGDSMSVAEGIARRVYNFDECAEMFARGDQLERFSFSNHGGFAREFVEVQVWDAGSLAGFAGR